MATDPILPTIDYTSRDYLALRADMIRLIRVRLPQWTADNPSDFGVALVEAYAYGIDIVNYYLDRVANEAYLSTAVQRESLYSIADMFNYTPRSAQAATVQLSFTNVTQHQIAVPAGTRVQASIQGSGGVVLKNFETTLDATVPAQVGMSPSTLLVPATEGRTYRDEAVGVSTGFAAQQYLLPRTSVLEWSSSVVTQLAGSTADWHEVSDLSAALPGERAFQSVRMTDGSTQIRFGDGLHGAIPELHSVIRATYRVGGGTSGNVAAGAITAVVDPVIYGLSVTNPSAAAGGVNQESLDSIRINAARSFRSRDRAVTLVDYVAVAESADGIAKAKAVGNSGSSVTVYAVPDSDSALTGSPPVSTMTDALRLQTVQYIQARAMAGVTVSVFPPVWRTLYVKVLAQLRPAAYRSVVQQAINDRIAALYSFLRSDFDLYVSAQDIATALQGIEGVLYSEVTAINLNPDFPVVQGASPTRTIVMSEVAVNAIPYWDPEQSLYPTLSGGVG